MKKIKLSQGKVTLVDDEDFEYLNQFKWCAMKGNSTFYVIRHTSQKNELKKECLLLHRVIMNAPKGVEVDHIDHNGLNNQKYNLRLCTNSQNHMNRISHGKSKYLGVSFHTSRKYIRAVITIKSKHQHIGYFKTEKEAALAYDKAALKYFGEFANLNFK